MFSSLGMLILAFLPNNSSEDEVTAFDYAIVILFLFLFSLLSGMLYTVLASSVSLLADKKRLGTAWGVIGTAIGLGESVSPIVNGLIEDDSDLPNSYQTLTFTYAAMSSVAVIIGLVIYCGPFQIIDSSFNETHTLKE
jgi:MFS family permease